MKNIKKILGLSLAVILSIGVVGCNSDGSKDSNLSKLEQIKKSGKLVLATSADYPPYEFHKMIDGKDTIVGFDVELAKELSKELGVQLEINDMDFDGLLGALNADKADIVMAGMTPSPERSKSVDFSDVYYEGKNVVIVKKGQEDIIKTDSDLINLKVGVQRGSTQEKLAQTLGIKNVTSLTKASDLILDLQNNKVDVIVIGSNVAQINVNQFDGLSIGNTAIAEKSDESSAIAFKKSDKNKELIEKVNKKIKELKENKKIDEMMNEALKLSGK